MSGRTPADRARRGAEIRALLEQAPIREAFEAVEEELTAEWKRAQSVEERETLWRALHLVERVRTWLRSAASYDLTAMRRAR